MLATGLDSVRSLSQVQADGTFFVGTSGNAQTDLVGELLSFEDTDSSAVFRYTEATGLEPWLLNKPSQLITLFDIGSRQRQVYQAGINQVEVRGDDLFYSILYNAGPEDYETRSASFTAETGITFGEFRRVENGATDPDGEDTLVADIGAEEVARANPDGVVFPEADGLGHQAGDPVFATNPYGFTFRGNRAFIADAAANTIYSVKRNGQVRLRSVLPFGPAGGEPVPIDLFQDRRNKLYVTLYLGSNQGSSEALGGVARVKPNGEVQIVSFNRLPIAGAFGPDGYLYVLEFADQFAPNSGRLLRTTPQAYDDFDGRPESDGEVVIDNLAYPVDFAFGPQGEVIIAELGDLDPFVSGARIVRASLP